MKCIIFLIIFCYSSMLVFHATDFSAINAIAVICIGLLLKALIFNDQVIQIYNLIQINNIIIIF